MAAEIVLSPLLQAMFEKLTSLALGKLEHGGSLKKDFERLKRKLPVIQAVIEDAENRQLKEKKVAIWLTRLKDVVYDADELLDELNTQNVRRSLMKNKQVLLSYLILEPFTNSRIMSRKLKDIQEKLDEIASEMSTFQFKDRGHLYERSDTRERERRETGPDVDEMKVYGRQEDAEKIVEFLTSTDNTNPMDEVSVIPIVGIGGLGKTTLAQLVYNDQRVTRHFDLRMWVSVNDNFKVRKVLNDILDYAAKDKCHSSQIGVLQSQLRESLSGKRYLLVLDDVWNENKDEWDKVKIPLRVGADGSKIIVTTRSRKVALIMSNTPPYTLGALGEDDCWTLFKQRAFQEGEEEGYPNLLPIGKQIVKKCKGVPFAAKILGSLMLFKREERLWSGVEESELWNLDEGENRILSVLRLSYNHLPPHLKRCFAYCAVFPKNYEISREKLIYRWVAEGLIQESDDWLREITMEDTGNEYFNDLLLMCFFHSVSKGPDGRTTKFIMHDLIHDLAQSVAGNEFSILRSNSVPNTTAEIPPSSVSQANLAQTRHASVIYNFQSSSIPEYLFEAKKLRTLSLLPLGDDSGQALLTAIGVFKRLRVLDLSGSSIQRLHKSIGDLMYLRYLDLSDSLIEILPETVGNLCNLQTLNLSGCSNLIKLPSGLTNLINLRHLNNKDCVRLSCMPARIVWLPKLQTLPIFIVGHNEDCLPDIYYQRHLRGELKIKNLENVGNLPGRHVLINKMLHSLELSWRNDEGKLEQDSSRQAAGRRNTSRDLEVLNIFKPNRMLRRLSITDYFGFQFPIWMNDAELPNLTELALINCRICKDLPTLGRLPSLKLLNIHGMDAVVNIDSKLYVGGVSGDRRPFPSLNELTLGDFPNLKSWEGLYSNEAFTCLDRLCIIKCPSLITMPWLPHLRHLELRKCNPLIFSSAAELNQLSTLVIADFPELSFLPEALLENNLLLTSLTISSCPRLSLLPRSLGNLKALKSLTISWCEELYTLPYGLGNLTSLETLEIIECPSLIFSPKKSVEGLSSLRSLSIENCASLTSMPRGMEHLRALEHLTILYCPNLVYLYDLQQLSSLRGLTILSCPKLASLPEGLQHVRTLQNLDIQICPKLTNLPERVENLISLRSLTISDCENIKSLPVGLQYLTALQHLSIRACPELERRCEKERGEDWHKISHIPYRYIGMSTGQQRQDIASSSSNP